MMRRQTWLNVTTRSLRRAEGVTCIHWASPEEERAAFAYFERHQDQTYSFVDCLSFVVMEKLGIDEALAVDSDFTHRFTARPGPLRHRSQRLGNPPRTTFLRNGSPDRS